MKYKKLKNGKYEITINNNKIITYDEVILKNNILYRNDIDINFVEKENEYYDIYYKCIKLINKKLRSINEISKIASIDIVNRLIKEGYLNDQRYVKAFIHDELILSNNGPKIIKYKLIQKGIDEDIIDDQINNIDENILFKKIEKISNKYPYNKAINYLLNKGYDYEIIKLIIKKNQD